MGTIDYSIGFSVHEVEEILAVQKTELKKTLTAYASDGSSVSKRRVDEIHAIVDACQRALQKLDPQKYPRTVHVGASFVDRRLEL